MNRDWKPGDVAVVKGAREATGVRALWTGSQWATENRLYLSPWRVEARPLVVIDPEDRRACEDLADALSQVGISNSGWDLVRAALREFANPTPRIEEPKGLGAVVEDDKGKRWVRCNPSGAAQWLIEDAGALVRIKHQTWFDLNAVRVLSPGVEDPS